MGAWELASAYILKHLFLPGADTFEPQTFERHTLAGKGYKLRWASSPQPQAGLEDLLVDYARGSSKSYGVGPMVQQATPTENPIQHSTPHRLDNAHPASCARRAGSCICEGMAIQLGDPGQYAELQP